MKNDPHSYLLFSEETNKYTLLNRFLNRQHMFEGEYSILHNSHTHDAVFLSKFLLHHQKQPLLLLPNGNNDYLNIIKNGERFLEDDIEKHMEEKQQKKQEENKHLNMERSIGQFQLLILKEMIQEQLKSIHSEPTHSSSEHQITLGKELSLQWVLHTIKDIIEKGNQ